MHVRSGAGGGGWRIDDGTILSSSRIHEVIL
jgi:hypothetical protein